MTVLRRNHFRVIIFLMMFSSCQLLGDEKRSVFITDKDFVQFSKSYSPDSMMILLSYGIDKGALGYGHAGTAILKLNDTVKNLELFTLPNIYYNVKWMGNKTAAASYDVIPDLREGIKPKVSNKTINGVKVIIEVDDGIGKNFHLKIEHREISPNGKKEFVAYRYTDYKTFTPIHISVIEKGDTIPRYGNFFIGTKESDYILNSKWDTNNQLLFYTNKSYSDMIQYYLVKSRPNTNFYIIDYEKKYESKYLWTE